VSARIYSPGWPPVTARSFDELYTRYAGRVYGVVVTVLRDLAQVRQQPISKPPIPGARTLRLLFARDRAASRCPRAAWARGVHRCRLAGWPSDVGVDHEGEGPR